MKYIVALLYFFSCLSLSGQISNLSFGTENTLDILTWNIENFPKNGTITVDYVNDIIEALDPDIIAIQEITNTDSFQDLIFGLTDYNGLAFNTSSLLLGYVYKSDVIEINQVYEIYNTSQYWNIFPRAPLVLDFNYAGERYIIINNHYKCCGDGFLDSGDNFDEETRRYNASNLLKSYIDSNFDTDNVILLGDLNDDLVDTPQNNVFQMFIDDSSNYVFTDINIAAGNDSNWSYPSWPSHLDHILITNELFDEFAETESAIETIKIDDYLPGGFFEYDQNVSDHRPVGLKLFIDSGLSTSDFSYSIANFKNVPNPFNANTQFTFNVTEANKIEIYNLKGQKITTLSIPEGQTSLNFNAERLANGIYIAKLTNDNTVIATRKIVLIN